MTGSGSSISFISCSDNLGDQIFKYRQSSLPMNFSSAKIISLWKHSSENSFACNSPFQLSGGSGDFHLRLPRGALAKGIPFHAKVLLS